MNEKKLAKKARLIIEVPEEFHRDIAMRAAFKYQTIKYWILEAIAQKILLEDQYK